ncbi:fluoride efflux transporter CrcB [Streptomyces sp. B1866]|uniref:fluoride efflux transporter CrcB n=1 Tax=Streptomyces sp. B1866 TaxID=3075431 RepID=UPI00288DCD90|nr:fluoride efflux transporter CrcB [Streptomyces sp. B1866]MDT3397050.1 fluoride efflux transporter CrcB [Streptomyces sp. B1866]
MHPSPVGESTAPGGDRAQAVPPAAARWRGQGPVVAVVAVGGAAGAVARYAAGRAWPTGAEAFPWPTLAVNAAGCALIGVLTVLVSEVWSAHRLLRPLLGTGVLGGFTTFSTYAVDVRRLVGAGHAGTALAYLAANPAVALAAVWAATAATRRAAGVRGSAARARVSAAAPRDGAALPGGAPRGDVAALGEESG